MFYSELDFVWRDPITFINVGLTEASLSLLGFLPLWEHRLHKFIFIHRELKGL